MAAVKKSEADPANPRGIPSADYIVRLVPPALRECRAATLTAASARASAAQTHTCCALIFVQRSTDRANVVLHFHRGGHRTRHQADQRIYNVCVYRPSYCYEGRFFFWTSVSSSDRR